MMARFNWKLCGTESIGNNPPIPIYQCEIGKDKNGDMWLCRSKYRELEKKFMIWFDKDIETDDDTPFLRDNVVYAECYWKAMRDYHKMVFCDYRDIQNIIAGIIEKNGLT